MKKSKSPRVLDFWALGLFGTFLDFQTFMNNFTRILIFLLLANALSLQAQTGGDNTYEFLHLSTSARVTALGGTLISVSDDDAALANSNPATLNPAMSNQLTFNHHFHLGNVQNGYFGFAHYYKGWKTTFHGGIQYINYGEFSSTDEIGNILGTFKAKELAYVLGAGRQLSEHYRIGANLRYINSRLEGYESNGISVDLAAMYRDTAKRLGIALVFKNAGRQVTTYTPGVREPLPFEIQLGLSHQLKYLPLRLSVTANHLERWSIRYDDPNVTTTFFLPDDQQTGPSPLAIQVDNFFRHMIFSGEFLLGKRENLRFRIGYNHLRKKEMSISNFRSLAGFSGGFGIKINRFRLEYGYEAYHIAGGAHHLSIATDIDEFLGKIY